MAKGNKNAAGEVGAASPGCRRLRPRPDMSLARKIAWWSLLAMVFIVPIAMSNFTWLGGQHAAHLRPVRHRQGVRPARLRRSSRSPRGAGTSSCEGGKIRRTPVDWLILAFLAWVALTTVTVDPPATAFFGKYRRFEGLLSFINYAVIYFLVLQFADRPSRVRTLAQTLFWSGVVVAGYGVLQCVGVDPVQVGHSCPSR